MTLTKDEKTMPLQEIVPEYESRWGIIRWIFHERILEAVRAARLKGNERVLDAGCGDGRLLSYVIKRFPSIRCQGMDFNKNVKILKLPCKITVADARNLPYKTNNFDVIFALSVLEHIPNVEKAMREFRRVLSPRGVLIVTGPTESLLYKLGRFILKGTFSEKEGPGTGVHYHTIYGIKRKLLNNGFTLVKQKRVPSLFPVTIERLFILRKNKLRKNK